MLLFGLSLVLGILVPAVIVRLDLRRLHGEFLARSWPDASLWSAVVVFGPFCLPVHFIRTRRSWWGLVLGAAWLLGALLAVSLPVEGLARLFGVAE